MIKKITLTLVIAVSLVTAFVGCSSDDSSEEQQNFNHSYNINPPSWLHGKWEYRDEGNEDPNHPGSFTICSDISRTNFTKDDIYQLDEFTNGSMSWKDFFDYLGGNLEDQENIKFYDKSVSSTYYEAERITNHQFYGNINLKVEKISNTSIRVTIIDSNGRPCTNVLHKIN